MGAATAFPLGFGQVIDVPFPGPFAHVVLDWDKKSVKANMVPLPSDLWTVIIVEAGKGTVGFRFWICGSFHWVMVPKKMFARTVPVKLSPFPHEEPLASFMLYAGTTALADIGMVMAVLPD